MTAPSDIPGIPEIFQSELYDYDLPERLVAQEPAARREEARLLHLALHPGRGPDFRDRSIPALAEILRPGDLIVLNDTRVVPARLLGWREETGGRVEVLVLAGEGSELRLLVGTRGRLRLGERLVLGASRLRATLVACEGAGVYRAQSSLAPGDLRRLLDEEGRLPLPPYIRRNRLADPRDMLDRERYQTVYARQDGAVAAPTAGLHLTTDLLASLETRGVRQTAITLHVGPGTFRPVTCADLRHHTLHEEEYVVEPAAAEAVARCRREGGRVVAVGTTTVRVLEAAGDAAGYLQPGRGRTRLFIHEPFQFRLTDALLTNFHAPRSTLLMLVAALVGRKPVLQAYAHAVQQGYRFLSYGDAMFIEPVAAGGGLRAW